MHAAPAAVALAWHLHPAPVLLAAAATGLFAQGFARLRRRSPEHAGAGRAVLFVLAVLVATLPVVSPLDTVADDYLLSAHMLEHVLIGDVAPALALLAVRGPLVFFLLPRRWLRVLAGVAWLRRLLGFLLRPLVAFVLWTAVTGIWHVPAVYDFAVAHPLVHELEHMSFVVAGVLVWAQLIDPARRDALTVPGRILYAWGLFVASHLTTHLILLDGVAHYGRYVHAPERLLRLSPVADQHWAAWVMTIEQLLAFGLLTAVLLRQIPVERSVERAAERPVERREAV